jgi:archaellum component FlaC
MATTTAPEQGIREAEARGWRVGWEQAKLELEQAKRVIEQQKGTIELLLGEKCELLADLEQFKKDRGLDALNQKMKQEVEVLRRAHKQEVEAMRKKMDKQKEDTESLRALAVSRFTDLQRSERRVRDRDHELETFKEEFERLRTRLQERDHECNRLEEDFERLRTRLRERSCECIDLKSTLQHYRAVRAESDLILWEKKDLKIMMSGLFQLIKSREDEGEVEDMKDTIMNTMANLLSKHRGQDFQEEVEPIRDALKTTMEGLFLLSEDQEEEVEQEKVVMNNGDYLRMTDKLKKIYQLRVDRFRVDYHQ